MADPGPVASCLWVDDELESQLRLDGIVTVVDAKHIDRHLSHHQEHHHHADDDDDGCHPEEAFRQICVADRLLINKTDLASDAALAELESTLRELNGMARIQKTEFSRVDLKFILGLDCYGAGGREDPLQYLLPVHCHDDDGGGGGHHHKSGGVTTIAMVEAMEVGLEEVKRWVGQLLWQGQDEDEGQATSEIYRLKGTLAVAQSDAVHILQAVHETFEVEPSKSLTWNHDDIRECRLVAIGRRLDEGAIRQGFRELAIK